MELLSNIYIYIFYIEVNLYEYGILSFASLDVTQFSHCKETSFFFNSQQLSLLYTSRKEYCYCTQLFKHKNKCF